MRILQSMLTALVSAPTRIGVLSWLSDKGIDDTPEGLASAVLSATGEVSSLVYAARLLDRIEGLDEAQLEALIDHLAATYDLDTAALTAAANAYDEHPDARGLAGIASLAEPRWVELFRRLNATDGGTVRLVKLRQRILAMGRGNAAAARLDGGLKSLLRMWFNPGFLILQPIDWST
ncbi:MAG: malonyl-CoA decarboxylase N-terminal domain-containing protein, partial [Candidatus Puniceispirillaceae bacterium]